MRMTHRRRGQFYRFSDRDIRRKITRSANITRDVTRTRDDTRDDVYTRGVTEGD